jgi:ABC-type transport system substrate-binding protein
MVLSAAVLAVVVLAVICAGCTANNPAPATTQDPSAFIAAANNCSDMNLTVTNTVGTFSYESTTDCALLKTLVKMNESEQPEVKTMLEGKSMVCGYTKGNFDSRWVTTLIGGMENCHGDLRDGLAQLIVFTS